MGGNANSSAAVAARQIHEANLHRRAVAQRGLGSLLGGLGGGAGAGAGGAAGGLGGLLGGAGAGNAAGATSAGTKTAKGTVEAGVAAAAGAGAASGLPTAGDDGAITMNFHQVNQDGAGPLTASVDGTSGGSDPSAFKSAAVTQNVPGLGIGGLSGATTTDFPVTVQMPAGMTCSGSVGGASNVCIVKVQNSALAGPFGGSAAFTQSAAAKKRAIEYNLSKRRFARALAAENA
jgi:Egh16-like virulence factor